MLSSKILQYTLKSQNTFYRSLNYFESKSGKPISIIDGENFIYHMQRNYYSKYELISNIIIYFEYISSNSNEVIFVAKRPESIFTRDFGIKDIFKKYPNFKYHFVIPLTISQIEKKFQKPIDELTEFELKICSSIDDFHIIGLARKYQNVIIYSNDTMNNNILLFNQFAQNYSADIKYISNHKTKVLHLSTTQFSKSIQRIIDNNLIIPFY